MLLFRHAHRGSLGLNKGSTGKTIYLPRIAGSLLMIHEALQAKPVATVATLRKATGLTTPTINSLLRELASRGIVKESTGRSRDRVYVYRRYLEALAAEEEAPVTAAAGAP
jgi:Fic family protein